MGPFIAATATYKNIFPHIASGDIWFGQTYPRQFGSPIKEQTYLLGNVVWYTNIGERPDNERLHLTKWYSNFEYPSYDNYDAIDVSRVYNIPCDYDGVMGVPVSYLTVHDPAQFDILGCSEGCFRGGSNGLWTKPEGTDACVLNGKRSFNRIFIKKSDQSFKALAA